MDLSKTSYEEDLKLMEEIPRSSYMEIYTLIRENMWEYCNVPSIGDIADFIEGKDNDNFNEVTEFLDNEDKLQVLLGKENSKYSNEESETFIEKVISSNTTEISQSGWFYKKLMASTDDIVIIEDSCGSSGVKMNLDDITEDIYEFRIRYSHVVELGRFATETYQEFLFSMGDSKTITVKTPSRCLNAPKRKLCSECSGTIKKALDSFYQPRNFGVFSTLMITEHATQASLDTMNKGSSENVNNVLEQKFSDRRMSWEKVQENIDRIVKEIGNVGVQSRFYEVALISRVHKASENLYMASSFQFSITHQEDLLGAFIFANSNKNFAKMVSKGEFEANSIKTQIMFDVYNRD